MMVAARDGRTDGRTDGRADGRSHGRFLDRVDVARNASSAASTGHSATPPAVGSQAPFTELRESSRRHVHAPLLRELRGLLVPRVDLADRAHPRGRRQHALQGLRGLRYAVRDCHLTRVAASSRCRRRCRGGSSSNLRHTPCSRGRPRSPSPRRRPCRPTSYIASDSRFGEVPRLVPSRSDVGPVPIAAHKRQRERRGGGCGIQAPPDVYEPDSILAERGEGLQASEQPHDDEKAHIDGAPDQVAEHGAECATERDEDDGVHGWAQREGPTTSCGPAPWLPALDLETKLEAVVARASTLIAR